MMGHWQHLADNLIAHVEHEPVSRIRIDDAMHEVEQIVRAERVREFHAELRERLLVRTAQFAR